MKKLLIAAMSILIITAFSACGSSTSTEETTPETTAEASAETTAAKTPAEPEVETTNEVETTTEAETESATEAVAAESIYRGNGYTIDVDSDVWVDFSSYIEEVSKYADEKDLGLNITSEDIQNVGDSMFMYLPNPEVNFNVTRTEIGDLGADFDLSLYGDLMENQYSQINGCTYLGDEVITVNGNKCLKLDIAASAEVFGNDLKMSQYVFLNGTIQYVVTYTAGVDSYDSALPDFEKMLNTITFNDN